MTRLRITSQLLQWAYQLLETDYLTPWLPWGLQLHRVRICSNCDCDSFFFFLQKYRRCRTQRSSRPARIGRRMCLEKEKANNTWTCFQKRAMNTRWDKNEINMINAAKKKGGKPPGGSRHCRLRPLAVIAKSSLPPARPFKKRRDPVISSRFSSAATAKAGKVKLEKFLQFFKSVSP